MKTLKKSLALLLAVPMIVGVMSVAKPAAAMEDLGELIVMNGLFTGFEADELAGLIAVDEITGAGSVGGVGSDLGDLIVLGGLFGWGWNDAEDLAGLIAIDNIF